MKIIKRNIGLRREKPSERTSMGLYNTYFQPPPSILPSSPPTTSFPSVLGPPLTTSISALYAI